MDKEQFKQMLTEIILEEEYNVRNGKTPICDLIHRMVKISKECESWCETRAWT